MAEYVSEVYTLLKGYNEEVFFSLFQKENSLAAKLWLESWNTPEKKIFVDLHSVLGFFNCYLFSLKMKIAF